MIVRFIPFSVKMTKNEKISCPVCLFAVYLLDTIQDFLRNLGMKPHMHLVEISIFSLNHVIVRPTKIIKDLGKAST